MTAELDRVRPGESSRCGALLEKKEVANKVDRKIRFQRTVGCLSAKQVQYVLEVPKIGC